MKILLVLNFLYRVGFGFSVLTGGGSEWSCAKGRNGRDLEMGEAGGWKHGHVSREHQRPPPGRCSTITCCVDSWAERRSTQHTGTFRLHLIRPIHQQVSI